MILRGVFVEMADCGMDGGGIEGGTAKSVEIGDQAGIQGNARLQVFGLRNAFVDGGADAAFFAERGVEPWLIASAHTFAGAVNPGVDAFFEEERDDGVDGAEKSCGARERGGRSDGVCAGLYAGRGGIGREGHGAEAYCATAAPEWRELRVRLCSSDKLRGREGFVKLGLTARRFASTMIAP